MYQVLSGLSVSQGTLCLMTHPHPWNILKDERGCKPRVWDAGPEQMGGGLYLTGSVTEQPYATSDTESVPWGTKCRRVQTLERLSSLIS